ncbi:hypothetical protein ACFLV0_01125 [Chloroflexota bacterium]
MGQHFETVDKVKVREWGGGVIIGSCPWQMTDATPNGKVWIVKLNGTGKVISTAEAGLEKL